MSTAKVVETSDAKISYHDVGSGPVFLVLHGGGPGASGWGNFSRNIPDFEKQVRLIMPDQPGFGESRFTKADDLDYQIRAARAMVELLQKLDVKKAHVLGNSMGGGVTLRMAMQAPDLVDRIVLMGPHLRDFPQHLMGPVPSGLAHLGGYFSGTGPSMDKMRALIRTFVAKPDEIEGIEDVMKARYDNTMRPDIQQAWAERMRGQRDPDSRSVIDQVRAIKHKTLLIWGKEDKFVHLEQAFQYMAALKNSELVVLPETGHWVQVERRAEFAKYVKAFLLS